MKRVFTEEEIILAIKEGGRTLDQIMSFLYQESSYKAYIGHCLVKIGGKEDELEDVFQEGMRHLILNIRQGKFRAESTLKTYFARICINLWRSQYRRSKRLEEIKEKLPKEIKLEEGPDEILETQEKEKLLAAVLSQLGKTCKKVLGLWSLSYSMAEIAKKMSYKSDGMARKKKYDCFKKLMKLLQERPDLMDELLKNR